MFVSTEVAQCCMLRVTFHVYTYIYIIPCGFMAIIMFTLNHRHSKTLCTASFIVIEGNKLRLITPVDKLCVQ